MGTDEALAPLDKPASQPSVASPLNPNAALWTAAAQPPVPMTATSNDGEQTDGKAAPRPATKSVAKLRREKRQRAEQRHLAAARAQGQVEMQRQMQGHPMMHPSQGAMPLSVPMAPYVYYPYDQAAGTGMHPSIKQRQYQHPMPAVVEGATMWSHH